MESKTETPVCSRCGYDRERERAKKLGRRAGVSGKAVLLRTLLQVISRQTNGRVWVCERCQAPGEALLERIKQLEDENEALRKALRDEWLGAHAEHCSNEWPHPPGKQCHYPPPEVLGGSQ